MKRRLLAVLLCVCLLIPFMSIAVGQVVAEEKEEKKSFVIRELSPYVSTAIDLSGSGKLFTSPAATFDPLDLENGEYKFDNVAIMFDTYMTGTQGFMDYMSAGRFSGQFEITSSGVCDKQEWSLNPGAYVKFAPNAWKRVIIPLSAFLPGGDDKINNFNKANFNYMRMYFNGGGRAGQSGAIKIVNWCLVDLSVPEADRPTEAERPLGDGTFEADAPVFHKIEVSAGYDDSVTLFAGYNLKEYIASHPDVKTTDNFGRPDYTPVVNSLLEGLSKAGGGALFIPAGEWEFRGNIAMPAGTSIIGEWTNPDENPIVRGTILKVYAGAGNANAAPFISVNQHSQIRNVAFWYPEQTVDSLTIYPPTIVTSNYTFIQNVTLVNSYFGIQNKSGANCPNVWDVYGTPLNIGVDMDKVIDIARIQEVHFAAKYWENSGLAGAPTSAEAKQKLADQLYNYAIGIILRRIDWSYATYSDITGYNIGLLFDVSADESRFPNGQCVGMTFTNCKYGHFSYGASNYVESLTDITMKNCEYGIYSTNDAVTGIIQYYNADIQATKYAVWQESSTTKLTLMASTVRGGRVYARGGNSTFINNKMWTEAPQIELDYGTVAAIVLGNTDAYGDPIEVANTGHAALSFDNKKVKLDRYSGMTREEAAGLVKAPAGNGCVIPTDLDITGATDVTEKIQGYLTQLGKNGGGILFLQPGKYRIEGTLTVPTGVELRGAADYASVPMAANTLLYVYTPIEAGKDEYTSTATITLQENSGIRGVIFNYPNQNLNPQKTETVLDPVTNKNVDYYKYDFVPYPYTIRGTGADVYVVNVSVRNGWNGVDLKTYRCDNHYIDYLAGHFYNRGIVVGNGSTNGYIRNYQFNYNSILNPTDSRWAGFGGEPTNSNQFHQPMQAQFNNNSITLQLGYVEDQLVYNCFNYASYIGVHLVEENGRAANARIYGHGVDYATVGLQVEAAEDVEFTNLQLTAFNQAGADKNTERYAVDQTVNPIYDIWLKDSFDGEITITNFTEWATSPNAGVRVDGGKLNMYNAQFNHTVNHLFELNGDGVLNIVSFSSPRTDSPMIVDNEPENLFITAGFYHSELKNLEGIGAFDYVHMRKTRNAVPDNVEFDEDSEILFAESFDDYTFTSNSTFQVDNVNGTSIRRGAVRMRLNASQFVLGLKTGHVAAAKVKPFVVGGGNANDLYRLEWRFSVDQMRATEYSEITLCLYNQDAISSVVANISTDGALRLADGTPIAAIDFATYYRLAVEIDARKADAKTMTVYLLDDDSRVIAKSAALPMPEENFQGENIVCGFYFTAMADMIDAPETETDFYVDYFYVTRSEKSTIGAQELGDVDGNGKIDSTDARLILQYAVGKIDKLASMEAADVDGNGTLDSSDARLILQYAVGKIKKFPAA